MAGRIRITRGDNPYQKEVQGKANEPITVAALLDRARSLLSVRHLDYSLEEIWDRLEENAPRVAIIGGSPGSSRSHLRFPDDRPCCNQDLGGRWRPFFVRDTCPLRRNCPIDDRNVLLTRVAQCDDPDDRQSDGGAVLSRGICDPGLRQAAPGRRRGSRSS